VGVGQENAKRGRRAPPPRGSGDDRPAHAFIVAPRTRATQPLGLTHENCPRTVARASGRNARETVTLGWREERAVDVVQGRGQDEVREGVPAREYEGEIAAVGRTCSGLRRVSAHAVRLLVWQHRAGAV
jgi:hypothetical protein